MYSTIFSWKHCFSLIFPQFLIDFNLYSSNYFFYFIVFFNQNVTFRTISHIHCLFSFNNLNLWFGTQLLPSKRFYPIQLYLFEFFLSVDVVLIMIFNIIYLLLNNIIHQWSSFMRFTPRRMLSCCSKYLKNNGGANKFLIKKFKDHQKPSLERVCFCFIAIFLSFWLQFSFSQLHCSLKR